MSTIEFVIDMRERELISKLEQFSTLLIVEQLPIGDILFRKDGETILVIERKTVADLKASITDGRAREQKTRLLGTTPKERILYLVEGDINQANGSKLLKKGIPVSTIIGSMINTQFRDGIKVYKTTCIEETVEFLRRIHEKLESDLDQYFKETHDISDVKYASTLKKCKKENMNHQVWFITQLSLIPRVTEDISEAILKEYFSMKNLIIQYESVDESSREKLLSKITYITKKSGKEHKVGLKLSSDIYKFLYGVSEVSTLS